MKYRHGDVLLLTPVTLPSTATVKTGNIVAEGEATGHAHRLEGGTIYEDDGRMFITAGDRASMTHEEHGTRTLEPTRPGLAHPVIIQREYDDEQEWRSVMD
jgi:hypothetical protein